VHDEDYIISSLNLLEFNIRDMEVTETEASIQGYSVFCHSRESGNPSTMRTVMDSRFRGNDKRLLLLSAVFFWKTEQP